MYRNCVYVEGTDRNGKAFEGWLQSDGKRAPLKMNTLVDVLEEVDLRRRGSGFDDGCLIRIITGVCLIDCAEANIGFLTKTRQLCAPISLDPGL